MVLFLTALLGAVLVVAGISIIFVPAGIIAGGVALIVLAYLIAEETS